MAQSQPVQFTVFGNPNTDAQEILRELQKLSPALRCTVLTLKYIKLPCPYISCRTDQATYETVFAAKLRYGTKTIPDLNRGPRKVSDWVEDEPAKVPDTLKNLVKSIAITKKIHLTD